MEAFFQALKEFAREEAAVEGILLVGSYARGTNRETSDLDLCILTTRKEEMVRHPAFVGRFGEYRELRREEYGACTSIRVFYKDGREVEFGMVDPSWIRRPLDEGTKRVLRGGYRVLADKRNYFAEESLSRELEEPAAGTESGTVQ